MTQSAVLMTEVVLDTTTVLPCSMSSVENFQQLADVFEVEAGGGFVNM